MGAKAESYRGRKVYSSSLLTLVGEQLFGASSSPLFPMTVYNGMTEKEAILLLLLLYIRILSRPR
jgi:hypothetical protein